MEKKQIKKERSLNVVKKNDIVQKARYKLDLIQQKTLMYLISKIDSIKDVEFQEITVNLKDLCGIMGINERSGTNLKDLKDAIQKLADKSMWVEMGDADDTIVLMRWLSDVEIKRGRGTVTVQFDKKMAPYLLQIKDGCFTQYKLIDVLPMKSQYSLRLYELIKSHNGQGKWEITVEELRKLLFVDANTYSKYEDFRRRILDTAILEICNFTDLIVAYEPKRRDRKIYSLTFEMCNIDEANWTEEKRREINRNTVLDNMPAEVAAPRKMPTVKDVRALREKQRKAIELEKMIKRVKRSKSAGGVSMQNDFMPGQGMIDDLM